MENLPTKQENKQITSFISEEEATAIEAIKQPLGFIPELKVTYKTSEHFAQGKAKLGEFFLDNQSLGSTISLVVLDYCFQSIARKKAEPGKGGFVDKLILSKNVGDLYTNPLYLEFKKKNEAQCEFEDCPKVLVFLPDFNLFGELPGKKKLADGTFKILSTGGNKRILKVSTVDQSNKDRSRVWYILDVKPTNEVLTKIENEEERMETFKNSIVSVANEEEIKATGRDR